jgi:hypothetical protein
MNCLYGDSTPSPLDDHFLELLPVLVSTAAEILSSDERIREIDREAETIGGEATSLAAQIKILSSDVRTILDAHQPLDSLRYLVNPKEQLTRDIENLAQQCREQVEDQRTRLLSDCDQRRAVLHEQVMASVAKLFLHHVLPDSEWQVRWCYDGTALSPVSVQTSLYHPLGFGATFSASTPATGPWSGAVPVSSLVEELVVQVPEPSSEQGSTRPSKLFLSSCHLVCAEVSGSQRLLLLVEQLDDGGPRYELAQALHEGTISIRSIGGDGHGMEQVPLAGSDQEQVLALMRTVAAILFPWASQRGELGELTFGQLPMDQVTDLPLVALTLLRAVAPYVRELALRSPYPEELTLKRTTGDHKREELFLPIDDLLSPIRELRPAQQDLFSCLGLVMPVIESSLDSRDDDATMPVGGGRTRGSHPHSSEPPLPASDDEPSSELI